MGFAFRRCRWFTATRWKIRLLRTPCTAIRSLTAMVERERFIRLKSRQMSCKRSHVSVGKNYMTTAGVEPALLGRRRPC